jgi:hypothetical protein
LELLAQNPVLRLQLVDDGELPPIDPTGEEQEQELDRAALHGGQGSADGVLLTG